MPQSILVFSDLTDSEAKWRKLKGETNTFRAEEVNTKNTISSAQKYDFNHKNSS